MTALCPRASRSYSVGRQGLQGKRRVTRKTHHRTSPVAHALEAFSHDYAR